MNWLGRSGSVFNRSVCERKVSFGHDPTGVHLTAVGLDHRVAIVLGHGQRRGDDRLSMSRRLKRRANHRQLGPDRRTAQTRAMAANAERVTKHTLTARGIPATSVVLIQRREVGQGPTLHHRAGRRQRLVGHGLFFHQITERGFLGARQ